MTTKSTGHKDSNDPSAESTDSPQAEKALLESEEKYRTLFDSAGDAIFIHDKEGRILAANPMAIEQLGYTHAELMSMIGASAVTVTFSVTPAGRSSKSKVSS